MPEMTDPVNALVKLQAAVDHGQVDLNPCEIYPDLRVIADQPGGRPRFTYANIERGKVLSVSLFVLTEPIGGIPCFQVGYAVIESMRQRGLASDTLAKGIQEFRNGFKRNGAAKFYAEAVVAVSNTPSTRLAQRLLSDTPKQCVMYTRGSHQCST
jgi:hypothetical protein